MKLRPIAYAIGITLLVSQSVNALPNGKPFQELNALIEENATAIDANGDLIEQNSTAILSLSTELSALDVRVIALETDVSGLTTRFDTLEGIVNTNTSDIALANAKITTLRSDLSSLDAVVETNTQAIADAEAAIAASEADLDQLNIDLDTLSTTVSANEAAITDVQDDIAAAEARLVTLEKDVATNAAEIDATNSGLNDLNASLDSLQAIVYSSVKRIALTELDINASYALINTLTNQYHDLLAAVSANADASDAGIAALKAELLVLIEVNETSIADNEIELVALSAALSQLAQDNSDVAQELRDQMLALALLVDSNSTSITALTTQVSTLSGGLAALNAQYNSLSSLYGQLSDHVDGHHDELAALSLALSNLNSRIDLIDPGSVSNPLASFSYTDEYSVTNINHNEKVRQFFRDTPTLNRWVYVMMHSPSHHRTTELCVKDNDVFEIFSIEGDHNTNWVYNYNTYKSSYRLNNAVWTVSQIQLRSSRNSGYDDIDILASSNSSARTLIRKLTNNDTHESYHQNYWWTDDYHGNTNVTYTIADDRMSACGY